MAESLIPLPLRTFLLGFSPSSKQSIRQPEELGTDYYYHLKRNDSQPGSGPFTLAALIVVSIVAGELVYNAASPIRDLSPRAIVSGTQNDLKALVVSPENDTNSRVFFNRVNNLIGWGWNQIETMKGHPAKPGSYFNP